MARVVLSRPIDPGSLFGPPIVCHGCKQSRRVVSREEEMNLAGRGQKVREEFLRRFRYYLVGRAIF